MWLGPLSLGGFMKAKNALKWLAIHLPELIAGIALIVAIFMAGATAFSRYIFNYTYGGNDEITCIAFAYVTFLGTAAAYRYKMHYGVDLVVNSLPKRIQPVVNIATQVIVFIIMVILTALSVKLTTSVSDKMWTYTQISYVVSDMALVLGFGLMTIYSAVFLVQDIKKLMKHEDTEDAAHGC